MHTFSLLAKVQAPNAELLRRMVASVLGQSNNDWELVLVTTLADQATATKLAMGHPNIRVVLRPDGELLAWSCNALLSTLGGWAGFIGQHDQLTPDALERMAETIAGAPQAQVVYSDEEALGTWGQVSLQFSKGAIDPVRLLSTDYLQDLSLIRTSWLGSEGGFDHQASDRPRHDLYLRLLASVGPEGFAHTPLRLYRRHRNRLLPATGDPRDRPYLPGYDLQGARRHFDRVGIPAKVAQLNGVLDIDFRFEQSPSVTVVLVLGDNLEEGKAQLMGVGLLPVYQPWQVRVLYQGVSPVARERYQALCQGLRYPFREYQGSLPETLNQEASTADTALCLFLQGLPLNAHWLRRLVDLTLLPGIKAAGPTLITPTRQVDGGPWDSRGQFNHLAVPHSVSVLSPACLLVDTRLFLQLGGFEQDYPTLYGMDFCLRMTRLNHGCARTPRVQVQVPVPAPCSPEEALQFRTAWAGWEDPYGLHQLP